MTNEQLDLIELWAKGSGGIRGEPFAAPADTLKLIEEIRRLQEENRELERRIAAREEYIKHWRRD